MSVVQLLEKENKNLKEKKNVTDPLIIPFIFTFLSCCKKAHDNKEFSDKNSKNFCES